MTAVAIDKQKALDAARAQIEKSYGKGAIWFGHLTSAEEMVRSRRVEE